MILAYMCYEVVAQPWTQTQTRDVDWPRPPREREATVTPFPPPWPEPTSMPDPMVRVRHYSRAIGQIRNSMSIISPDGLAIWAEYPITTPYEEAAIQKTTKSFMIPLNGTGGFVEFNVDERKWLIQPDPNLGGIPTNAKPVWIRPDPPKRMTGFPLSEPGVNPEFYNWKGQPLE